MPRPTGENTYQPELTGMRAVAIAIIFLGHMLQRMERFHTTPFSGLESGLFSIFDNPFSGCPIFFALTGHFFMSFMMTRRSAEPRSSVTTYVVRRFLRLLPPYFIVLLATYVFLRVTGYAPLATNMFYVAPSSLTASLFAGLTMSHEVIYCTFPRLFPPGWFVETQAQFYLVAPAVFSLYLRMTLGKWRSRIGYGMLFGFSALAALAHHFGPCNVQYSLIEFMPYFWGGAMLATTWSPSEGKAPERASVKDATRTWSVAGWCAMGLFILLGAPTDYTFARLLAQLLCISVMMSAAHIKNTGFHKVLASRYLAPMGIACFSLYLVHLQILQVMTPIVFHYFSDSPLWLAAMICLVLEIPALLIGTALFYYCIERPCLVNAQRLSRLWASGRSASVYTRTS